MIETSFDLWNVKGLFSAPAILSESLDSTHAEMKRNAHLLKDGSLIMANEQKKGKGRHLRNWISPYNKNLYFNFLLPLNGVSLSQAPLFMQVTAIAIAELLKDLGIVGVNVKWPNDIWVNREKLGGIIAEVLSVNSSYKLSVGVGLNVNVSREDLMVIDRPTTSLSILSGENWNREILLQKIVLTLENAFESFQKEGIKPWLEKWEKMDLFLGNRVCIVEGEKKLEGILLGINENGSLALKTPEGVKNVFFGDLEI
jgi:BirA family biotin operon repressor/biotin-[acetyl-CoA-carboxylase] ligase